MANHRRGAFWTDEREATLREMLANGATLSMVAGTLGTTKNAALGKAMRLGIVNRPRVSGWPNGKPSVAPPRPRKLHNDGVIAPPIPMPEPILGGVPTVELTGRMCRFVLSADAPWFHCGDRTEPLTAWCSHHRGVVYRRAAG